MMRRRQHNNPYVQCVTGEKHIQILRFTKMNISSPVLLKFIYFFCYFFYSRSFPFELCVACVYSTRTNCNSKTKRVVERRLSLAKVQAFGHDNE